MKEWMNQRTNQVNECVHEPTMVDTTQTYHNKWMSEWMKYEKFYCWYYKKISVSDECMYMFSKINKWIDLMNAWTCINEWVNVKLLMKIYYLFQSKRLLGNNCNGNLIVSDGSDHSYIECDMCDITNYSQGTGISHSGSDSSPKI